MSDFRQNFDRHAAANFRMGAQNFNFTAFGPKFCILLEINDNNEIFHQHKLWERTPAPCPCPPFFLASTPLKAAFSYAPASGYGVPSYSQFLTMALY